MKEITTTDKLGSLLADSETLITFGLIVAATFLIASLVGRYMQRVLRKKAEEQKADITSFVFVKHVITTTIYLFGLGWALLSLPISVTFAHSLFAGAGVSTLILGFASQQVLGNVMSGIFLILKRPFKIGDTIEIQGNQGKVIELNLHDTVIEEENGNCIIIPNALISNGIIKNIKNQ